MKGGCDEMNDYKDKIMIIAVITLAFAGYEIITSHPLICLALAALYLFNGNNEKE